MQFIRLAARGLRGLSLSLTLAGACLGASSPAHAATSVLLDDPAVGPASGTGLNLSWPGPHQQDRGIWTLAQANTAASSGSSLQIEPKHRWFARLGGAKIKVNDESSDARDVTGPVLTSSDHPLLGVLGLFSPNFRSFGIPAGVTVDVRDSQSVYGSIGKFLDDNWAVEGLILAAPFKHDIYGAGTIERLGKVATVKQLPPTLILHRYFGNWGDKLRPSLGVGLNYTYFFDAEATPALESYTGGPTDIKMKPSTGWGVFAGLQYQFSQRLHLKLTLGYVTVRTTATLTTRDTMLSSSSPVLQDYPAPIPQIANSPLTQGILDSVFNSVAQSRGGTLGTYERKIDSKLDPYVVLLSVGYAF
ncbi:MAG: hypothetical protein KatS3mg122_2855 [Caldimonas sp.]|uniref:OmpW/AlkL family protein n=1 Tax=Caldimonas taiwanensis TaxID=307483 RepID=UPI000781E19A|nr:OmpW family outer membrane protein [Caldimonas taiwanensis]GIX25624.1 MAG: hypothetical protein KatS3mg122_2855 [Caldimonas sp.]